jgi:hypothetical protein
VDAGFSIELRDSFAEQIDGVLSPASITHHLSSSAIETAYIAWDPIKSACVSLGGVGYSFTEYLDSFIMSGSSGDQFGEHIVEPRHSSLWRSDNAFTKKFDSSGTMTGSHHMPCGHEIDVNGTLLLESCGCVVNHVNSFIQAASRHLLADGRLVILVTGHASVSAQRHRDANKETYSAPEEWVGRISARALGRDVSDSRRISRRRSCAAVIPAALTLCHEAGSSPTIAGGRIRVGNAYSSFSKGLRDETPPAAQGIRPRYPIWRMFVAIEVADHLVVGDLVT